MMLKTIGRCREIARCVKSGGFWAFYWLRCWGRCAHPNPSNRVAYLKQLINQGGFNRYAYEGAETHLKMRHKMGQLLTEYKLEQAREEGAPARKLP